MSNDPRMPEKLNIMYETLVDSILAVGYNVLSLEEYGVSRCLMDSEIPRRMEARAADLPVEQAERLRAAADAMVDMTHVSALPTTVAIRERLHRALRETGQAATECMVQLRGGAGGMRGILTETTTGLLMMCPDVTQPGRGLQTTGLQTAVHFAHEDVIAVGFPVHVTVEGSKIHVS